MRYRKEIDGDYAFGLATGQASEFWVNQPEAVAQAVQTRLRLMTGEWFLDLTEGTPYSTKILGKGTLQVYDLAIKNRVVQTPGVTRLLNYKSSYNNTTRRLQVDLTILTSYSLTPIVVPTTLLNGPGPTPVTRTDAIGTTTVIPPPASVGPAPDQ